MNSLVVVIVTLIIVAMCVTLHYEVLSRCSRLVSHLDHRRRRRIISLIFLIIATHVIEIWLFAVGYAISFNLGLGSLEGVALNGLTDYAYYSATVYTTVGFGDIVPTGPVRLLTGMEGLIGLVMITWSASFTFLYMQRHWRPESDR